MDCSTVLVVAAGGSGGCCLVVEIRNFRDDVAGVVVVAGHIAHFDSAASVCVS